VPLSNPHEQSKANIANGARVRCKRWLGGTVI
jgi:hypothetical protein